MFLSCRFLNAKTDEERKEVEQIRQLHRDHVSYTRERNDALVKVAGELPHLFLSIVIDGMDNKKAECPRVRSDALFSKDVDNAGKPLKTRLVGGHVQGRGFFGFWIYPYFKQGGSGCATLLHRIISKVLRGSGGTLPRILLIHMDNTCKENKNNLVIKYLAFLVFHGVFDEVRILFLLVGHTHTIIDQRFSVITRELSARDAYTLPQLLQHVGKLAFGLSSDLNYQQQVKQSLDWEWLNADDLSWFFQGFATKVIEGQKHAIHSIRICKDANGQVAFQYKEHDRPGPWSGHHVTGQPLPVFKKAPIPPGSTKVLPRRRIDNFDKVLEKVKALKLLGFADAEEDDVEQAQGEGRAKGLLEQRAEGAKEWWKGVDEEEKAFWSDKPAAALEAPQQVDPSDPDLQTWLPLLDNGTEFRQPSDTPAYGVALAALDGWDAALPPPDAIQLPPDEKWVGRRGVEGEVPDAGDTFNPQSDLMPGQIVLFAMHKGDSTLRRGWEVVLVKTVTMSNDERGEPAGKVFTGQYLRPLVPGRAKSDGMKPADWPALWWKLALTELTTPGSKPLKDGTQRTVSRTVNVLWDTDPLDVDLIFWGFTPSGASRDGAWRLTPTAQKSIAKAVKDFEADAPADPTSDQQEQLRQQQLQQQQLQQLQRQRKLAASLRARGGGMLGGDDDDE